MGAQDTIEEEKATVSISPQLQQQVAAKATSLNLSFDQALAMLLSIGLTAQALREEEIERLATQLQESPDEEEQNRLGDELGRAIFNQ
jgi:hypothetical protein